jgi:nucleotide-binding universal stress UspA family protein
VPEHSNEPRRPSVLCYDGSDFARRAIRQSASVLGGGPAIVLTVYESLGSALLRHAPSETTELGRQVKEISEDVVNDLDAGTGKRAQDTAGEGAELAVAAGFDAEPLARRAVSKTAERDTATIWRAILDLADERDAAVLVVGSRGASALGAALLGSVSYGLVHNSKRSVLVVPPSD